MNTATDAILWALVLLGAIALLAVVTWIVRRWAVTRNQAPDRAVFSLQHLRDMRDEGQITQKEFETLKAKLLEPYRASPQRKDGAT